MKMEWKPIETAEKTWKKAVIVYCPEIKCSFFATWDDITNEWRHFGGSRYPIGYGITHWMQSPEAPNT